MADYAELFVEGNQFAGLADFGRKVCDILAVQPVQGQGAVDGYVVCQTMGMRLVMSLTSRNTFPYCNYRISVENESAQEAPSGFAEAIAEAIAEKLAAADLVIVRVRLLDRLVGRVLRYSRKMKDGRSIVVTTAGKALR